MVVARARIDWLGDVSTLRFGGVGPSSPPTALTGTARMSAKAQSAAMAAIPLTPTLVPRSTARTARVASHVSARAMR